VNVVPETSQQQPVWLWPNLLSLDAPVIAVLWLHLIAVCGRIPISRVASLTLGLVVWLIYAADRLFDGLRSDPTAVQSPRHRFYRTHRKVLLAVLLGVLALTCCICLELDPRTLLFGTLIMLVIVGYFLVVHWAGPLWRWRFPKEAVVAIVFGVGTFFPALVHARGLSAAMAVSLVLFVMLCWLNVVLIEYAEWVRLRRRLVEMPHSSTVIGGKHLLAVGVVLAIASLWLMQPAGFRADRSVLLAIFLSALALAGLGIYWRKLSTNAVRVLADATLLTPAFVLLFLHRY
jgi:hypothetical protein